MVNGSAGTRENEADVIYEIIILAMIAAFLGLRLYSVLGRRAEHEEEPVPTRFEQPEGQQAQGQPRIAPPPPAQRQREYSGFPLDIDQGLRAIAAADRNFDLVSFLEGARGAYGMVLEAYWTGDKETLMELCDSDVYQGFAAAIDEREAAGEKLDNRLIRIEEVEIRSAGMAGRTARIALLFKADIAAVTRDSAGNVVAGSLDDAIDSRDIWTFSRDVSSADPHWLLDETDEG
jgi:predicted lipid-binding transport protein (Tim44 family)